MICGPRDFILNLLINSFIPWYLTKEIADVSIFGNPSLASLFVPMGLILVGCTSFFGFFNGITRGELSKEILINKFKHDNAWLKPALIWSGIYGLIGLISFLAIILLINYFAPTFQVAKNHIIVAQGLIAAFLAYGVQVNAVFMSQNLSNKKPREKQIP